MNRELLVLLLASLVLGGCGGVSAERSRPVRIMPLGDSITQGYTPASSYRSWLWRALVERGYRVDFVGNLTGARREGERIGFDADHEGHWGWRADQVKERVPEWARRADPDVVLIHLGHNDLFAGESPESTAKEIVSIVRLLRRENPRVAVLVAQIIPSVGPLSVVIAKLNRRIADLATNLSTPQSPVLAVELASGFDPATDTVDGVHPNERGARKMAAAWLEALAPLLE